MDSFLWEKGCLMISELWNSAIGRRLLKLSHGRRKSLVLLTAENKKKNPPQNQKYKPPSVSGTDVAQFPTVLNDLGGNAENQVNGEFPSLELTDLLAFRPCYCCLELFFLT